MILGANLGHRLHPLQHYEYKGKNKIKIGLDIVMDYIKVVCKQIYIEMFVSRTKWQMQSGVKSGANTLYPLLFMAQGQTTHHRYQERGSLHYHHFQWEVGQKESLISQKHQKADEGDVKWEVAHDKGEFLK